MCTERSGVTKRVHLRIIEVIVTLRVSSESWVVLLWRQSEGSTAAPAPHQFCRNPFLLSRRQPRSAQCCSLPENVVAAVDVQRLAGHRRAIGARQKHAGGADLLDRNQPARRRAVRDL